MKHFLVAFLWVGLITPSLAQDTKQDTLHTFSPDSLSSKKGLKTISIENYSQRFDPRKAMLYSAVLPGTGQVYNKKYWKVPLVYGGLLGLISVVNYYQVLNTKYRNELFTLLNTGQQSPTGLTEAQLRSNIDQARRQRDYFLIFTGFFYLLQMVDAHVDAHLKEFSLNPKLKVRIEPALENNVYTGSTAGIAIKFKF